MVNLAAVVVDGSRIYVPHVGETIRPEVVPTGGGGVATTVAAGPVNVNVATLEELDRLPGVGPATAAAPIRATWTCPHCGASMIIGPILSARQIITLTWSFDTS